MRSGYIYVYVYVYIYIYNNNIIKFIRKLKQFGKLHKCLLNVHENSPMLKMF